MVRLLLQADATIAHLLDNQGISAIHIAASKDYANVIEEILHHCPDATELTDIEGSNFLHVAVKKRAKAVVQLVLSNPLLKQSINETDHNGNTPLHLAAMDRNREIVHLLLLDRSVDTNVINRKGFTPLDIVSSCVDSSIRLRMKKMFEDLTSVGSKFGTHRMDILMGKDQRRPEEELNRYRTLASNLTIVAVLIATVTFAAAFTLPGGYNNDGSNQGQGMAILAKKLAFKVFLISDTISMLSSISVTCLVICTGSLDHDIRLHSIITAMKFMWVALGGMVVAFSMGIYVVVVSECRLLAILICGMAACVPFMAWMIACWPTFSFIKLVQNDRNKKTIERISSIFKLNMLKPNLMVVEFVTPRNTEERPNCEELPIFISRGYQREKITLNRFELYYSPKGFGGLGIPSFDSLYFGVACSYIWRFFSQDSIMCTWLKAKYLSPWKSTPLYATKFWKFICFTAGKILNKLSLSVGINSNFSMLWDPWCNGRSLVDMGLPSSRSDFGCHI
ncbi:hypothetical protein M5K25_002933 [Dendrobium thyrsiflorum]|uniref:PGG domain-containing protein n=1 Tax=Dendrobium thyrsiflorum TaxID=117978 RepID=A0ABD0VP22_DENTH